MLDQPSGEYFRAYLASDDLSTAAAIPLVDRDGNTRTLVTGERIVISSLTINNGATASKVTIFQDADGDGAVDAGEELYAASLGANGQAAGYFEEVGLMGKRKPASNGDLKAKASIASVGTTIIITGVIHNS